MHAQRLRQVVVILLCMGWIVCAVGCREVGHEDESKQKTITPLYGGVYRRGLHQEPITLDPAFVTGIYASSVVQQLFDGLVQFDAELNVLPGIARSWSASPDGKVWTFHLRQDVKFHNGRLVTADDFVYSFTRILDPQHKSPRTWLFNRVLGAEQFLAGTVGHVAGLRALDDKTLQITLAQPYAPFITILGMAQAKVVPREEVERLGDRFGRQPIGTGPFRFVTWVQGDAIDLEANMAYFEGRPFLNRLRYKIFSGGDRQAIFAVFERNHIEDAYIPAQVLQRIRDDTRYRFIRKTILATLLLWFDLREGPLSQPKVRQAINHAINRPAINRHVRKNRFEQAGGILPLGMPGYNPELVGYAYDPTRARQLLREAGYPDGQGLPPLELWSSTVSPTAQAENEAIQRDLAQIGVTVQLRTAESWQHYTKEILGKRPNALYRYAWHADFPDPDNFLFVLFHSQSANNYGHYHNPQVDQLLIQAQREVDYLQRMTLYRDIEKLIMADAPTVNLVYYTFEHAFQPYVKGIEVNALGERYIPMKKIWLDTSHHAFPRATQSP